jgi:hypothetical protein
MSLSDCPKCWSTPCECGHEYRDWKIDRLEEHIEMLSRVLAEKKKGMDEEGRHNQDTRADQVVYKDMEETVDHDG